MLDLKKDSPFLFVGNSLWLDFVNTQIVQGAEPVDLLTDAASLHAWAIDAHLLQRSALDEVDEWGKVFQRAIDFRSDLTMLAQTMDQGHGIGPADLHFVNSLLGELYPVLNCKEDDWSLTYGARGTVANAALSQIALSAATLIADGGQQFVHKCESPTCVLYFNDTSKNHKRRWCSMASCGNRHKAAVHYRRRPAD